MVRERPLPVDPEPTACDDVALGPDGSVFVNDTGHPRLYVLKPGAADLEVFVDDPELEAGPGPPDQPPPTAARAAASARSASRTGPRDTPSCSASRSGWWKGRMAAARPIRPRSTVSPLR